MMGKRTGRWIAVAVVLLGAIAAVHRLWHEFKWVPVHCAAIEPMGQEMYERLSQLKAPVPTNMMASVLSSYPDPTGKKTLASLDLARIRFNLAWIAWSPFNCYHISVYSKTNVVVEMDDDRVSSVVFTKTDGRWQRDVRFGHVDRME